MNKIYYVVIKGRTLESRDLKELLARAVSQKRNMDRKSRLQAQFRGDVENGSHPFGDARQAAML